MRVLRGSSLPDQGTPNSSHCVGKRIWLDHGSTNMGCDGKANMSINKKKGIALKRATQGLCVNALVLIEAV